MSDTATCEQLTLFSAGKQEVGVDFDGGHIVTDAGLLAILRLVERLGIVDDLAEPWPDPRCPEMVRHSFGVAFFPSRTTEGRGVAVTIDLKI